jgi:PAS domain S-box-containing protein
MLFEDGKPHDFIYLTVNRAFETLTGLKKVAGKKVSEVIPGIRESDPGLIETYGRVALTGRPEQFETWIEALNMWFYISVYSPRSEHFIAVFEVITGKKKAEEALKASEVRYRRLFESAKDGVLILDAETGAVDDVNPFLIDLLGFRREQIIGMKVWELGFLRNVIASQVNFATLQEREYIRYEDLPLETSDGRKIDVEFVSNVYLVNDHRVIQCNIRDISERKKAEVALQKSYALLQDRNAELDSFSYSVSHDLRGPLRSIGAFSGLLQKQYAGCLDDEGKSYLDHIVGSTERMAHIIDDLLNLSRISREDLKRSDVDLGGMTRDMANELKRNSPERLVEFIIDDMVVYADAGLMRIVMENLLSNAWKFTSKRLDTRIEFSARREGAKIICHVRDNGEGFDMAHIGKLFKPFQRLHSESAFPGTGIGLAIIHRIIERHGGRVWAEGEVGMGATIYFEIPDKTDINEPLRG